MPKIKLPLIISDFDGTLVRADGTIGEYTKNAIEKYIQDRGRKGGYNGINNLQGEKKL